MITFRGVLPPALVYHDVMRGKALGGFCLKKEARLSEAESAGTATSVVHFLLKTMPEQVSSFLEAVASTSLFCL